MKTNCMNKKILLVITALVIAWTHNAESVLLTLTAKERAIVGSFDNEWNNLSKEETSEGTVYRADWWGKRTGKFCSVFAFLHAEGGFLAFSSTGQITQREPDPEPIFKELERLYIKEQEEKRADLSFKQ
ncbi:MAG: hypothetical protein EBU90_09565 [Proteobacteria bacterium]|nr:hypothetical protein [Pseudomonadota bacterium]NBP14382.1 hypothetical protein [bacterium]